MELPHNKAYLGRQVVIFERKHECLVFKSYIRWLVYHEQTLVCRAQEGGRNLFSQYL